MSATSTVEAVRAQFDAAVAASAPAIEQDALFARFHFLHLAGMAAPMVAAPEGWDVHTVNAHGAEFGGTVRHALNRGSEHAATFCGACPDFLGDAGR